MTAEAELHAALVGHAVDAVDPGDVEDQPEPTRSVLRIVTMPIQPQGIITRENVSVDLSAVAYFRVVNIRAPPPPPCHAWSTR